MRPLRTSKEGGREKGGIRKEGWKEGWMREKARKGERGRGGKREGGKENRENGGRKKEKIGRRKTKKKSEFYSQHISSVISSEYTGNAARNGQTPNGTNCSG